MRFGIGTLNSNLNKQYIFTYETVVKVLVLNIITSILITPIEIKLGTINQKFRTCLHK